MRGILFLILVVVVLALLGWITFGRNGDRASINLETKEIRDDTQKALDSGAKMFDEAGDKIRSSTSKDGDASDN